MKAKKIYFLGILCCLAPTSWGQVAAPSVPAQIVLVFKKEPKEFRSITLDQKPFASLEVGMEFATVWPVPPGKHNFSITAPEASEKKVDLVLNPKEVVLILLDLAPAEEQTKGTKHSKQISLQIFPLRIPEPANKAIIFAFVPPGGKKINGEITHGNEAGTPIELSPGKLTSLGEGKTSFTHQGKQVIFINPGTPGVYVHVVLEDPSGPIRSIPFSFQVLEPEEAPKPGKTPQGPAVDY